MKPFALAAMVLGLMVVAIHHTPARGTAPPKTLLGMPLLFSDDFESGTADRWEFADAGAWRVTKDGDNRVLDQHQHVVTKTPVRSPFNRSLIKDLIVSDFVLEARVKSTTRDYPHRDLCFFYGFQDPARMYYTHLGKAADPHAHSIFIVNNADRVSIAKERTTGLPWDDNWHTVRIVRKVIGGLIEVYFDDMSKPIMKAEDRSFTWGRVGLGSFDDTGMFDEVRVWGVKEKPPGKAAELSFKDKFTAEIMEKEIEKWDPTSESNDLPVQRVRNPQMDVTGEWLLWRFLTASSMTVTRYSSDGYYVEFETHGCLYGQTLQRKAQLLDGILTLDQPVRDYSGHTFTKAHAVRIAGNDFLVPSDRVSEINGIINQYGTTKTERFAGSDLIVASRVGLSDVRMKCYGRLEGDFDFEEWFDFKATKFVRVSKSSTKSKARKK